MATTLENSGLGEPVAVNQIGRELKKLWDTGDTAPTRASLMNFAVYCRSTEALAENTELISKFTRTHACRALLICVVRQAPEPKVSAWVNAHCHLSRAGGSKQVCCEQITFLLEGEIKGRLTNIVFSNLDSDLPLYFWWQGDVSENLNPHLWSWIDRLFVDSLAWKDLRAQIDRLRQSLQENNARLTLRDLNWTRSLAIRQALSQIFDHPDNLPHLRKLEKVELTHAPNCRSTGLLFIGWLAAQLGWKMKGSSPIVFTDADGKEIAVEFKEGEGETFSNLVLSSSDASFALHRETGSKFFQAKLNLPGGHEYHHIFPAGATTSVELLNEEMGRSSTDRLYLKSIGLIETLL